jgi:hypothetical protein
MADAALGLAWVEVVETLPGGCEAVSAAVPMLLTTRCDICEEVSMLFEGVNPYERRAKAGVLRELAEVFHPEEGDQSLLAPSRCATLAVLCASHGLHRTLAELADEVVYRGPPYALALVAQAAEYLCPGGLLACAQICGNSDTLAAVSCLNHDAVNAAIEIYLYPRKRSTFFPVKIIIFHLCKSAIPSICYDIDVMHTCCVRAIVLYEDYYCFIDL